MAWICIKCGVQNDDGRGSCEKCGARSPFPPSGEVGEVEEKARFQVPRRGELTAALRHGIDSFQAGELSEEEFVRRLERASQNVPEVFAEIVSQIEDDAGEASDYLAGVTTSLGDCQALFQAGLEEMLRFTETGEAFHLRFGWLLVEKGEEEYVSITETLQRDSMAGEFSGRQDVLGRLAAELKEGRLEHEAYEQALERFEESAESALERASEGIREAIAAARRYDGGDDEPFLEATEKAAQAAEELGGLLLSLYHP